MARERRQTTQSIAWFRDLYTRGLLDLEPPYQRRSVWNQPYKDYFIETIMLQYPSPAIFLYEEMSPEGNAKYAVVDGKQRLTAVFEFTDNLFPISEKSVLESFRGLSFKRLPEDVRREFWTYQFAVESLPTRDEGTLNNIFDRINKNVARLTPQELRHAKFDGEFARASEDLAEYLEAALPQDFPRIASMSRRQMKDVELVSQLLLLNEKGVEAYSQNDLDTEYGVRDEDWPTKQVVETEFRGVVELLSSLPIELLNGAGRRLRNQADFYSLYGALLELRREGSLPSEADRAMHLSEFMTVVVDDDARRSNDAAKEYFEAARSASNDAAQRRARIEILKMVLAGEWGGNATPRARS